MENRVIENQVEVVVKDSKKENENTKPKSSFDARVRTSLLEALHLTKSIVPIPSVVRGYKRNAGYIEETVYIYKVTVTTTDSPYSGIEAFSNTEQDAIKKLNDALYGLAVVKDETLFKGIVEKTAASDKKRKEAAARRAAREAEKGKLAAKENETNQEEKAA